MILLCYRREEFMHWVEMLPDTQTPSWLGLPSNAEKVLLTTQGTTKLTVVIIFTLVFCHNHWTATHPGSSFSVHLSRFNVFTGSIINHLSLLFQHIYVYPDRVTRWREIKILYFLCLLWAEYCLFVCLWWERTNAPSAYLSSSLHPSVSFL